MVRNLPADAGDTGLIKGMSVHPNILAWRIPGTEEPGRLHTVHGITKSQRRLNDFHFTSLLLGRSRMLQSN